MSRLSGTMNAIVNCYEIEVTAITVRETVAISVLLIWSRDNHDFALLSMVGDSKTNLFIELLWSVYLGLNEVKQLK